MGAVLHLKGRGRALNIIFSRVNAPACTHSLTHTVFATVCGKIIPKICRFDSRKMYS